MSPSLKHYIKRALTLPPHIVLKKLIQMGKTKWELYRKDQFDEKHSSYLNHDGKLASFATLPEHPTFGNHLLDHRFDLLGSGLIEVKYGMTAKGVEGHVYENQPALQLEKRINAANLPYAKEVSALIDDGYQRIDWQIDFKSGYRWSEKTKSHRIEYGHLPGVDVKVPWELARMQHLPQLAFAYHIEKNEAYVQEFRNQILDFIANNPPRFGVNWSCTMDVGIRIANWLMAYDLFRGYGAKFDKEFEKVFISNVYDHGIHIINHLEWFPTFRSNHYLANIGGLIYVAAYLGHEEWFDLSVSELIKELPLQFHEDGSSFEGSTSYHCLSAQIFAYATQVAVKKKGKEVFPDWYYERMEKMAQFVSHITKPNGEIVQVGDHDSGYFFRLSPPFDNHLNRQSLIQELRMNPLPQVAVKKCSIKGSLNCPAKHQTHISFPYTQDKMELFAYPDFGIYIYRSPSLFLSIRVGSIGHVGRGGHAHNDQLSVELVLNGETIVRDPGTYLYTPLPKRRNDYRSVKAHFAPQVEGKEPSGIETGVFLLDSDPKGKCLHFDQTGFLGMHTGYGYPVYRKIELGEEIVITDLSEGEPLKPIQDVLKHVQNIPFSSGYGIIDKI